MEQEDKYWYLFSFKGLDSDGEQVNVSTYTGYPDKRITMNRIQANKDYAGVDRDACVISINYLGYMTRDQFMKGG